MTLSGAVAAVASHGYRFLDDARVDVPSGAAQVS